MASVGSLPLSHSPVLSEARNLSSRLAFVALVALYYGVFLWSYHALLEPRWAFWGFGSSELGLEYRVLNWLMVLLPSLWVPLELRRPSQLLFMCQYLVLFVPATLVLYSSALPRLAPEEALRCLLTMFAGLTMMQSSYLLPLIRLPAVAIDGRLYWGSVVAISLGMLTLVAVYLGANLQFIGPEAFYSVRADAADLLKSSGAAWILYATFWFGNVSLPVLFAVAVYRRSILLGAAILAAYVFLFGVTGTKTVLLAVAILGAAALVSAKRGPRFSLLFVVGISVLLVVPVVFDAFGDVGKELQRYYVAFAHARIFGVPQLLIAQYLGFFAQHPETSWAQVTGVGAFISDPYDIGLPRTLGYFYYGTPVGANAGLWAQDGIAAGGLPALFFVSIVASGVFWVFDSMAARVPARFAFISLALIGVAFINTPLPTTLVTGGMALLALLMYLAPPILEHQRAARRVPDGFH